MYTCYMCMCVYIRMYKRARFCSMGCTVRMCTYIYVHMSIYLPIYPCICLPKYIYIYTENVHMHTCVYIYSINYVHTVFR